MTVFRLVICSGEALQADLAELFYRKMPAACGLINLYGATETGADVSCYQSDHQAHIQVLEYFAELEGQDRSGQDMGVEDIFDTLNHQHQAEDAGHYTAAQC